MDLTGNRKVIAVIVMLAVGIGFAVVKGDIPANFLNLLEFLFGAFIVGNGIEHATTAYADVNSPVPQATQASVDLSPVSASMQSLEQLIHTQAEQESATQQAVVTVQQLLAAICKKYNIV